MASLRIYTRWRVTNNRQDPDHYPPLAAFERYLLFEQTAMATFGLSLTRTLRKQATDEKPTEDWQWPIDTGFSSKNFIYEVHPTALLIGNVAPYAAHVNYGFRHGTLVYDEADDTGGDEIVEASIREFRRGYESDAQRAGNLAASSGTHGLAWDQQRRSQVGYTQGLGRLLDEYREPVETDYRPIPHLVQGDYIPQIRHAYDAPDITTNRLNLAPSTNPPYDRESLINFNRARNYNDPYPDPPGGP